MIEANVELRTYKMQRTSDEQATEGSRCETAVRGDERFQEHTRRAIVRITDRAVSLFATQALDSAN